MELSFRLSGLAQENTFPDYLQRSPSSVGRAPRGEGGVFISNGIQQTDRRFISYVVNKNTGQIRILQVFMVTVIPFPFHL